MIIKENKEMKKSHPKYDEFNLEQWIIELDQGEKIEILINGKKELEFTANYINCHANIIFQDKGESKNKPEIKPSLQDQIDELKEKVG